MMTSDAKTCFRPGQVWLDTDGSPIQAHGGSILYDRGIYYWYGESKDGPTYTVDIDGFTMHRVDVTGINCYSSTDLCNWRNEGLILSATADEPHNDLSPFNVMERPRVIYNNSTGQYVMWLHMDTAQYRWRAAGVAISESPTGPFRYLCSMHPNGLLSTDQTVFKDDDGVAYHIHSSGRNSCTIISRLTDDYLMPAGEYIRVFDSQEENTGKESPALHKHDGRYYMFMSNCTCWDPNEASYAVADEIFGEWTLMDNPCIGPNAEKTFFAQNTWTIDVQGLPGAYIFMADRWKPENLSDSRYVWLPIEWEDDRPIIRWHDEWDLSVFKGSPGSGNMQWPEQECSIVRVLQN